MPTDTNEKGLEALICTALTGHPCDPPQAGVVHERPSAYSVALVASGRVRGDFVRGSLIPVKELED